MTCPANYIEIIAEAEFRNSRAINIEELEIKNYTIAGGKSEALIYSAIAAAEVPEATDLSNTAVNPTSATITASEVGLMTH